MTRHGETNSTSAPVDSSTDWRALLDNRWIVLAGLFLVTGALGIPFLWIGRAFSTRMKILLSIAVTLYTALLLWLFGLVMLWSYHRISESF
jgi:cytochrome c biogenesis protein CcdA